jgi:hypothetical protein
LRPASAASPTPEKFADEIGIAFESKWDRKGIAAYGGAISWDDAAVEALNFIRKRL